jgi:hypothetical protein
VSFVNHHHGRCWAQPVTPEQSWQRLAVQERKVRGQHHCVWAVGDEKLERLLCILGAANLVPSLRQDLFEVSAGGWVGFRQQKGLQGEYLPAKVLGPAR